MLLAEALAGALAPIGALPTTAAMQSVTAAFSSALETEQSAVFAITARQAARAVASTVTFAAFATSRPVAVPSKPSASYTRWHAAESSAYAG